MFHVEPKEKQMSANLDHFNEMAIIQKLKVKLARQQNAVAETLQHIAAIETLQAQRAAETKHAPASSKK